MNPEPRPVMASVRAGLSAGLTLVGCCIRSPNAVSMLFGGGMHVQEPSLEIRFRDTVGYVVPDSDPWKIVSKEDEVIEWRMLLVAPDLSSSPFAFATYEDVDYLRRETVAPLPDDLEAMLAEALQQ